MESLGSLGLKTLGTFQGKKGCNLEKVLLLLTDIQFGHFSYKIKLSAYSFVHRSVFKIHTAFPMKYFLCVESP